MMGAHVTLVDGLITDCGREVALRKEQEGWFDLSTLKEPYRVEGKKTLGYEIAEQLGWKLPDVIIYPTRRRNRIDRNVESLFRNGRRGLDQRGSSAHGGSSSSRVPTDRIRLYDESSVC